MPKGQWFYYKVISPSGEQAVPYCEYAAEPRTIEEVTADLRVMYGAPVTVEVTSHSELYGAGVS